MKLRLRAATAVLSLLAVLALAPGAVAGPSWAAVDQAAIRPGVQTITAGQSQCTSNFIFHDRSHVYIGQAAHCSMEEDPVSDPLSPSGPSGCESASLPLGTPVEVAGATRPGTLVYNSWLAMQGARETDPDVCSHNDFALIRLDPADFGRVNPTVPHWGGPTGLATSTDSGEQVYSYGSSELRFALSQLSPKEGVSRGQSMGGWNHTVVTLTPGIPGDSGSGFLNSRGEAFGVLSTLILLPQPLHNGVGDLSRQLEYMRAHSPLDEVNLATGTEPFSGRSSLDGGLPLLSRVLDLLDVPLGLLGELGL